MIYRARRRHHASGAFLLVCLVSAVAQAEVLAVGPGRRVTTLAEAARVAKSGDTVEVDAGTYAGDVAVWTQDKLTLRAMGGRVKLLAAGAAAEGKAIWVVRGGTVSIEGFEFRDTRVPARNGAGIRLEAGKLTVLDCIFTNNENGILTSNKAEIELEIVNSEFGFNGHGDGQSHNLYAGLIARLVVRGSYFHHANVGHLLKSRAAFNDIRYNRLTDEAGGRASYELEFANGGLAYVVGNIIEQSGTTENPHVVSFGAEGYHWPRNGLYLVHNTLIDKRPQGGVFLRVKAGDTTVVVANNLLLGKGRLEQTGPGNYRANMSADLDAIETEGPDEYHLRRSSALLGKAVELPDQEGEGLVLREQYVHRSGSQPLSGKPHNPGALQLRRPPAAP